MDIDLNISKPFSNGGGSSSFDVQNIMTHEIGHLLGLFDLYESGAVDYTMYWLALKGETNKRTLETDDKNGIKDIYLY